MREVGILEAKTNFSSLVDAVDRDGEEIVITRHGKPVAKLTRPLIREAASRPKLTGPELLERLHKVREQIARNNPDAPPETWEDIKGDGYR